jgi:hypothetical protein
MRFESNQVLSERRTCVWSVGRSTGAPLSDLGKPRLRRFASSQLAKNETPDSPGENVSVLTSLGAALLGARVGDVVEWQTRRGLRRLRIKRILFQPESAGAFDL